MKATRKQIKMDPMLPVVILCGGRGLRFGPVTERIPKPLIPVGDEPILWHVMKIYASFGCREFILCLGHRKEKIQRYFTRKCPREWRIHFVDTGLQSTKAERLRRVRGLIRTKEFFVAYGDDVADVDISKLLAFHRRHTGIVTVTAVRRESDFGVLDIGRSGTITRFIEKPLLKVWINGGFMVMSKKIFSCLGKGELESDIFHGLARRGAIAAYRHRGAWKAMNTLKDQAELTRLWEEGPAFWKVWKDT